MMCLQISISTLIFFMYYRRLGLDPLSNLPSPSLQPFPLQSIQMAAIPTFLALTTSKGLPLTSTALFPSLVGTLNVSSSFRHAVGCGLHFFWPFASASLELSTLHRPGLAEMLSVAVGEDDGRDILGVQRVHHRCLVRERIEVAIAPQNLPDHCGQRHPALCSASCSEKHFTAEKLRYLPALCRRVSVYAPHPLVGICGERGSEPIGLRRRVCSSWCLRQLVAIFLASSVHS